MTGAKIQLIAKSATKLFGNPTKVLQSIFNNPSTSSISGTLLGATPKFSTSSTVNTSPQSSVENVAVAKIFPKFYVRIVPIKNGKIIGKPTNEVKITFHPISSGGTTIIYTPVKAYEVKIKSFKPLLDPTPGVCRGAVILDSPTTIQYGTTIKQYNIGDRICPTIYKGQGEPSWYESLWSAMTSGVSWVSQAYNDLKSGIIDIVGSVAC